MRLAQHDTSDDNDGATAAKAAKFFPFLSLPITSSLLIMLIFPFLGSYFAGTCRSRVAGQTRRYCLNRRCFGRSVSSSNACWLACLHEERVSRWSSLCRSICWTGNFSGQWWRLKPKCSFTHWAPDNWAFFARRNEPNCKFKFVE